MTEFRQCTADGRPAWFHKWAEVAFMVPAGSATGGAPGGQVRTVMGIVEYEDGTMDTVGVKKIKFEDAETAGLRLLSSKSESQPMGAPFDEPTPGKTKTYGDLADDVVTIIDNTLFVLNIEEQKTLKNALIAYFEKN